MTDDTFDILAKASELRVRGEPFALATVTLSQRPTSARLGAKAVITPDGALFGWVGGACSQPSVVRHAREALADGQPRLVRLTPDDEGMERPGVISLPMTCHSGGTVEIFIEPFLPDPYLIAVGDSPIARVLATFGTPLGFESVQVDRLDRLDDGFEAKRLKFIVVATMGVDDEAALLAALDFEPDYLALVGSARRFATLAGYLRSKGVPGDRIAQIRAPAGLDISAQTPAEIALSIMAEIVQARAGLRQQGRLNAIANEPRPETSLIVIDPICGMEVDLATARHTLEVDGELLGFCCAGCLEQYRTALTPGRHPQAGTRPRRCASGEGSKTEGHRLV